MFTLPETLPTDVAALDEMRSQAGTEFDVLKDKVTAGEDLTEDEIGYLTELANAIEALDEAHTAAVTAAEEKQAKISSLIDATSARLAKPETDEAPAEDVEEVAASIEDEAPEAIAAAASKKTTKFAGAVKSSQVTGKTVGFQMVPNVPEYRPGVVGFAEVAESMAKMGRSGGMVRTNKAAISPQVFDYRTGKQARQDFSQATSFATLDRGLTEDQIIRSASEFEDKLAKAVADSNRRAAKYDQGALVAAAGWCAPSETIWDFCDVTEDNDLVSVPELNIPRGGLRFPQEPDMTSFYASLPFFYTAADLEAVPAPVKPCVEVPCTDFDEITKNATGICITVGLLQEKAWPELVAKYLAEVMKAHQHDLHMRTIAAMIAASGAPVVVPATTTIGAAGSILNSLAWQAVDIRVRERMGRRARIEGVAPSWLLAVAQADLALQEGVDWKTVSEQDVDSWLAARNISIQWVSDWQARTAGLPGDPAATPTAPPATVDILLYPSGAFFRHVDNVIEVGNLYDKAQLQSNTKTALFTEDEFAVGKRCHTSRIVTVPICVSGAIGGREFVACNTSEAPGAA